MNARARFGRALIVANPTSQSGAGKAAAERLARFLSLCLPESDFELAFTEAAGHATDIAARARGFETVFALGGDGTVHEVANGLMAHAADRRPALAVVPVGSGNDYARTLGILDWSGTDFSGLFSYEKRPMDVGRARFSDEKGAARTEHFVETLSVGLDAAVALGTQDLRRSTGLSGTPLYMASGLDVFGRGYRSFPARVSVDGTPAQERDLLVFAAQIGRTYGSGFLICPDADPCDGLLDLCYAEGPFPRAFALGIFLAAKSGRHTRFSRVKIGRAATVSLELREAGCPIQADGEQISATGLEIDVLPGALQVWQPASPR